MAKSSLDDFVHIVFVLVLSAKVVQASAMKVYLLIAKCSLSLPRTQSLPWPFHGQWHGRWLKDAQYAVCTGMSL